MYCSNCKGTVHRTTKTCPHCGGDFTKLFGPKGLWGKPPRKTPDPNYKYEPLSKRAEMVINIIGYAIVAALGYLILKVISWFW